MTMRKRVRSVAKTVWKALKWVYLPIDDILVCADLTSIEEEGPPVRGNFVIRAMEKEDLALFRPHVSESKMRDLVERFDVCRGYVAMAANELAGWAWTTPNVREREGDTPFFYRIRPKKGRVYFFDGFVFPHLRSKGIMQALTHYLQLDARKREFKEMFGTHHDKNKVMTRAMGKMGFKPIGTLRYRRMLGFERVDTSDLAKVCESN